MQDRAYSHVGYSKLLQGLERLGYLKRAEQQAG